MSDYLAFVLGFLLNLAVAVVIVRFIYYPRTRDKRYVFTFLAFNTIIYFVLSLMSSISLGVGVGFGLFAIFSVLRYRTDTIPIREMTYLFIILALPVMNSSAMVASHWGELLLANTAVLIMLWVLEKEWGFQYEISKRIVYENIELIQPARRAELLADLTARTGLPIQRVKVGKIDFLRDVAELQVYYFAEEQNGWSEQAGSFASEDLVTQTPLASEEE
ncbi:MAG: DUF4956 domain-containing protein [Anaerolineaceae bacterium]|jgi:hypothetical protein|nr:DUF4956 domain-containing protein [Anaerolineaceae bacterium]HNX46466.1 DUF4956 domain-containing protein [Anaerolineaceae bacterium]HPT24635.1 DUF4956 domain-containing protein [Anaerolineaceae bacterium]